MPDTTTPPIYMVKAAFAQQFTLAMEKNGVNPAHYLRQVRLPANLNLDPERFLPEKPLWRLINMVARFEQIPDFGSQVAKLTPWHKVASLSPLISQCRNLGELLEAFCEIASSQSNHVNFELALRDGNYWFVANSVPLIRNDRQMELYRITSMIQFIQLAAGAEWRPMEVNLFMPETDLRGYCNLIQHSHIRFQASETSVLIPDILLKLPVRLEITRAGSNMNKYNIRSNFLESLRQILEIYISDGCCTIELVSQAVEIPPRTLQRRLNEHGYTFNQLLGETRYRIAHNLLGKPAVSIAEVSQRLNYSDISHFTRAFKRWSGQTPTEYRRSLA